MANKVMPVVQGWRLFSSSFLYSALETNLLYLKIYTGERIDYFLSMKKKWNVRCRYVNTQSIKQIEQAITTETKAIFIETPTNPLMQVTDIAAVATVAKKERTTPYCRQHFLHTLYTATINRRC